jgi:hypothetical protein
MCIEYIRGLAEVDNTTQYMIEGVFGLSKIKAVVFHNCSCSCNQAWLSVRRSSRHAEMTYSASDCPLHSALCTSRVHDRRGALTV